MGRGALIETWNPDSLMPVMASVAVSNLRLISLYLIRASMSVEYYCTVLLYKRRGKTTYNRNHHCILL